MTTSFDRVPDTLARALAARGYLVLTPVQRAVLAVEPEGRDMLVSADTGSGKTVALGLALAGRLLEGAAGSQAPGAPRAAVITPTRELALQVRGELGWLYAETGLRVVCCAGGMDLRAERARLAAGCEVVVGSPGRLRHHVEHGALDARALGCVVLDEADDMLDMGFREDLEFLLGAAPPGRRTLMFSATVSRRIEALAARFQTDAARIDLRLGAGVPGDLRFEAILVSPGERERAVVNVLRYHEPVAALVFCATREAVGRLAGGLGGRGFAVAALSGALPQRERNAAMAAMREGRARVCVATDLAARGVDLPGLELVVHADLPGNEAALAHRSGRAGRAGREGLAVLIVSNHQRRRAQALAARAGVALHWTPAPSAEAVRARDEARMLDAPALGAAISAEERAAAARLLARHDAERVAVALLRVTARARPAPEALGAPDGAGRGARPRMEGGVWFSLDHGERGEAELRSLLPLICRLGQVTSGEVGRIVVGERMTRFEIAAQAAERFAAAVSRAGEAGRAIRCAAEPEAGRPAWRKGAPPA